MRTAVVFIHGIGEQKPMETLRGFVDAIVGVSEGKQTYYSKPDRLSELFELRRLQAAGRNGAHFFEYYWAYNVEGTGIRDVVLWLARLAARPRRDVPKAAQPLWMVTRILFLTTAGLALAGFIGGAKAWFTSLSPFTLIWFLTLGVIALFQFFMVSYLGDAARYLSPNPRNIRLRQKIRAEGIKLLRTLHERDEYERIVLVGHSLGSVIGYDILTHLWHGYSESLPGLNDPDTQKEVRDCMAAGGHVQPVVRNELSVVGEALGPASDAKKLDRFRAAQLRCLREQRRLGHPWRVTDFVTLGSPLAHAMLFLAKGAADFEMRKTQRELPTCPPQRDEKGYAYGAPEAYDVGQGKKFTPLLLHDGAPFAATRWTNLYIRAAHGLFGDIVGGPIAPALGYGIQDIEVRTPFWRGWSDRTLRAHLSYWSPAPKAASRTATTATSIPIAVEQLRQTIALGRRDAVGPAPWGTHAPSTATPKDADQVSG